MGNTAKLKYYWPQSCYELKTNKPCGRGLQSAIVSRRPLRQRRSGSMRPGTACYCCRSAAAVACGAALAQQSARMLPLQLCCPCAANCGAAAATHATRRAKIRCLVILQPSLYVLQTYIDVLLGPSYTVNQRSTKCFRKWIKETF